MLKITHKQRNRARHLLDVAETSLTSATEERLNLNLSTRLAIHAAIDQMKAAQTALDNQPEGEA